MQQEQIQQSPPAQPADNVEPSPQVPVGNTSGQGSSGAVPEGVSGWGWGPFLLTWIWAIGNGVWIGLLALVPYVGFVMAIILGVKGREWAWQAKKWDSVEHFNEVQKKWSIAGVVLLVAIFVITFISVILVVIAIDPVTRVQEEQMREQQFMDFQNSP